ncbi:MAG: L-lactate dehydrogenase [Lachnospiraceae bacterium]
MKGKKISVLGSGRVGSSLAYTLVARGTCSEIVLVDIAKELAVGEAMDIDQGVPFLQETKIRAGDYEDLVDSDIVVVTLGRARQPGQTRLELAQGNVDIIKEAMPIAEKFAPNAFYIIVSNPVDILTYVSLKVTSLSPKQVIGSGTMIDSARLRTVIANKLNVAVKNTHGYVLGEHGDSAFVPWSVFHLGGMKIENVIKSQGDMVDISLDEIEKSVHEAGANVIKRKGATNYAIAASVNHLCNCVLHNTKSIVPVSTLLEGEYNLKDVCLSFPCVLGANGLERKLVIDLTPQEKEKMEKSAIALKKIIAEINI